MKLDRGVVLWVIGCVSISIGLAAIGFVPAIEWKYGYYNWYTIIFVSFGILMFILDVLISFIKNYNAFHAKNNNVGEGEA